MLGSSSFAVARVALRFSYRITPQLKMVPLYTMYDTNGTHSFLNTIVSFIPYSLDRIAMSIWKGSHNPLVLYTPLSDNLSLLQSVHHYFMKESLLVFIVASCHYSSIYRSASGILYLISRLDGWKEVTRCPLWSTIHRFSKLDYLTITWMNSIQGKISGLETTWFILDLLIFIQVFLLPSFIISPTT